MNEETQRWINAGTILARNPESKVKCPYCQKKNLKVQDVGSESDPELLERYMRCSACGSWNVLRLRRPAD